MHVCLVLQRLFEKARHQGFALFTQLFVVLACQCAFFSCPLIAGIDLVFFFLSCVGEWV